MEEQGLNFSLETAKKLKTLYEKSFQDIRYWTVKDNDHWEMGNKWGEPSDDPQFTALGEFLSLVHSPEFRRANWKSAVAKMAVVHNKK